VPKHDGRGPPTEQCLSVTARGHRSDLGSKPDGLGCLHRPRERFRFLTCPKRLSLSPRSSSSDRLARSAHCQPAFPKESRRPWRVRKFLQCQPTLGARSCVPRSPRLPCARRSVRIEAQTVGLFVPRIAARPNTASQSSIGDLRLDCLPAGEARFRRLPPKGRPRFAHFDTPRRRHATFQGWVILGVLAPTKTFRQPESQLSAGCLPLPSWIRAGALFHASRSLLTMANQGQLPARGTPF